MSKPKRRQPKASGLHPSHWRTYQRLEQGHQRLQREKARSQIAELLGVRVERKRSRRRVDIRDATSGEVLLSYWPASRRFEHVDGRKGVLHPPGLIRAMEFARGVTQEGARHERQRFLHQVEEEKELANSLGLDIRVRDGSRMRRVHCTFSQELLAEYYELQSGWCLVDDGEQASFESVEALLEYVAVRYRRVSVGTVVDLRFVDAGDEVERYLIVDDLVTNAGREPLALRWHSCELGRAIIGRRAGEQVVASLPDGESRVEVVAISADLRGTAFDGSSH